MSRLISVDGLDTLPYTISNAIIRHDAFIPNQYCANYSTGKPFSPTGGRGRKGSSVGVNFRAVDSERGRGTAPRRLVWEGGTVSGIEARRSRFRGQMRRRGRTSTRRIPDTICPCHVAVRYRRFDAVRALLECDHIEVARRNENSTTALHLAARGNSPVGRG